MSNQNTVEKAKQVVTPMLSRSGVGQNINFLILMQNQDNDDLYERMEDVTNPKTEVKYDPYKDGSMRLIDVSFYFNFVTK